MGRMRPKYMGWAEPGPTTWTQPTLAGSCAWAQQPASPRLQRRALCISCMAREEVKAKEKGGGFTWRRLSCPVVANGGVVVPALPAVLVAATPLFFFFFLSPCFSLLSSSSGLLFFFFFSGLITLALCSLSSLLLCPLSSIFSAPFLSCSPLYL